MQPQLCLFSPRPEGNETSIMSYQTTMFAGNVKSSQAWLFSTLLRAKCAFTYQQESLSSFIPSHQFMRGVGLAVFTSLFGRKKRCQLTATSQPSLGDEHLFRPWIFCFGPSPVLKQAVLSLTGCLDTQGVAG